MKNNIRLIGLSLVLFCLMLVGCQGSVNHESARINTVAPLSFTTTETATITQTATPIIIPTITPTAEKIVPEKYQNYIGKIDPIDVPEFSGGGVVLSESEFDPVYGLKFVGINDEYLIILVRNITPHRTRNHEWEILDILVVSDGQENEIFIYKGCMRDDMLEPDIVGVAVLDDEAFIKRWVANEGILALWGINHELERFEVVSDLTGYECSPELSFMIGPSSRTPMP